MREIPPLLSLALRAVGPPGCNPEVTFGGPQYRTRPPSSKPENGRGGENDNAEDTAVIDQRQPDSDPRNNHDDNDDDASSALPCPPPPEKPTVTSRLLRSLREKTSMPRRPYKGAGRPNANDVDVSHPWILAVYPRRRPRNDSSDDDRMRNAPLGSVSRGSDGNHSPTREILTIENGNHAVDCLQLFIDALVESGRAGDSRLGVHFFREWVMSVVGEEAVNRVGEVEGESVCPPKKKRRKNEIDLSKLPPLPLVNLSSASRSTFRSMEYANVGICLGTLDLTGVHGLTDYILSNILCSGSFPRLQRLSLKNCRKVTGKGIASLGKLPALRALDIGGCFNIHPNDVISMVEKHPGTKTKTFDEIYASGLGWTDVALESIIDVTANHLRGLGIGFSPYISGPGLILTLTKAANTLDRLAIPFCEGLDDAAAAALGKNLPKLAVLDIRGCSKVSSLTGMMDGRLSAGVIQIGAGDARTDSDRGATYESSAQAASRHLFVLARYSGITKNSLEDTMRLHHSDQGEYLTCILDGSGIGEGIRR